MLEVVTKRGVLKLTADEVSFKQKYQANNALSAPSALRRAFLSGSALVAGRATPE